MSQTVVQSFHHLVQEGVSPCCLQLRQCRGRRNFGRAGSSITEPMAAEKPIGKCTAGRHSHLASLHGQPFLLSQQPAFLAKSITRSWNYKPNFKISRSQNLLKSNIDKFHEVLDTSKVEDNWVTYLPRLEDGRIEQLFGPPCRANTRIDLCLWLFWLKFVLIHPK